MRSTLRSLAGPLTAVALLLAAPSASAGSIHIDFDLSGSTISLLGGILEIPPDGTITSATARVTVPGSDLTTPSAGAAQLSNLQLTATIDGTVGGAVQLIGGFTAIQTGGGAGDLASDLTTLDLVSLALDLSGDLGCTGGQCVAIGTFPVSVTDSPLDLTGLDPFALGALGSLGASTLSGVLPFDLGGNDVVVTFAGQETARTFVPEPGTGLLLATSLAGLLCIRPKRR